MEVMGETPRMVRAKVLEKRREEMGLLRGEGVVREVGDGR